MNTLARRIEIASIFFILLALFDFFWSPIEYLHPGELKLGASDPWAATLNVFTLVFLLLGGLIYRRPMARTMLHGWPVLAVVGLAFASAFWSDAPALAVRRSGVLTLTTLFAMYLVMRLGLDRLCALLVVAFVLMGAASYVIVALEPSVGIGGVLGEPNAWRGAFSQKNTLGLAASLGTVICAYSFCTGIGSRQLAALGIALLVPLTILSGSKTVLLFWPAAAYGAILGVCCTSRHRFALFLAFLLVLAGGFCLLYLFIDPEVLLRLLDRNASFSGRTELWQEVIAYIGKRPLLGYGFEAFWRSGSFASDQIRAAVGWDPPNAHNGWLELGLDLGLVGISAVALLWGLSLLRIGALLLAPPGRPGDAAAATLCLMLFLCIAIENLTEANLVRQADPLWMLFVLCFVHIRSSSAARRAVAARSPADRRPNVAHRAPQFFVP